MRLETAVTTAPPHTAGPGAMTRPPEPPIACQPWEIAYLRIADDITARITAGHYTGKLPPERGLAQEYGVSYITIRHTTAILRERGLIISIHGKGTFVAPRHQPPTRQTLAPGFA